MKLNQKRLSIAMMEQGLKSDSLAKKAGVSVYTITNVKAGRSCAESTISKLSKALNVPVEELVDWEV